MSDAPDKMMIKDQALFDYCPDCYYSAYGNEYDLHPYCPMHSETFAPMRETLKKLQKSLMDRKMNE